MKDLFLTLVEREQAGAFPCQHFRQDVGKYVQGIVNGLFHGFYEQQQPKSDVQTAAQAFLQNRVVFLSIFLDLGRKGIKGVLTHDGR